LRDAWCHPYQYTTDGNSYELRSLGSDGQRETSRPRGSRKSFAADLVYSSDSDGVGWLQWPEGI
jgi:hypothetical protein